MTTRLEERQWSLAAGAVLLTALLYYRVVGLPLFMDDIAYIWGTLGRGFGDLFLSGAVGGYYRPFGLLPWKILETLTGRYPPAVLHLFSLFMFAIDGWLVGLLARRIYPEKRLVPWLAMAIFVVFPFSYQAVTWASALVHLLVACGTLIACLFADRWWEQGHRRDLVLAWLGVTLGAFSHENGAMILVLLGVWLVLGKLQASPQMILREWKRLALVLIPALAIVGLYVLMWMRTPKTSAGIWVHTEGLLLNLLYFVQGLAYPVTQFGGRLIDLGLSPESSALLLALVGLALLAALLWLSGEEHGWWGPVWYGIAILPPMLFLDWWTYVMHGPRLMLTASVGAALAWAVAVDALWHRLQGAWRAIPIILAGLLLAGGGWFVLTRLTLHDRIAPVYRAIYDIVSDGKPAVFVNVPAWIAYRDRVYALGDEGEIYQPDYYPFREMVWANTDLKVDVQVIHWHDTSPILPNTWSGMIEEKPGMENPFSAFRRADRVYRVRVVNDHWTWEEARMPTDFPGEGVVDFVNGVRLAASAHLQDRVTELNITWEVAEPVEETVFVHLLCEGEIVAQADGPPLGGMFPFSLWQPGESWEEMRLIPVPAGTPVDCLSVRIGLYHPTTGERVPLRSGEEFLTVLVRS